MLTICFTGRRPKDLCGYKNTSYQQFVQTLEQQLFDLCQKTPHEPIRFLSGGAQGFDQLAFWAVHKLKTHHPELHITNDVEVPFKGQEKQWPAEGLFSQKEYHLMLKYADHVHYLEPELNDRESIVHALTNRNHVMVNESDLVVALYPDNTWQTSRGGTSECMRYANRQNKPILQLSYQIKDNILMIDKTKMINEISKEAAKFTISPVGKQMLQFQDDIAKQYKYRTQPPEVADDISEMSR